MNIFRLRRGRRRATGPGASSASASWVTKKRSGVLDYRGGLAMKGREGGQQLFAMFLYGKGRNV